MDSAGCLWSVICEVLILGSSYGSGVRLVFCGMLCFAGGCGRDM